MASPNQTTRRVLTIVGPFLGLLAVIGLVSLVKGHSPLTAMALMIGTGAAIGLLNGVVIGALRMMPFVVTLGMMGIGRGLAKWLAGSQTVNAPETMIDQ